MCTGVLGRSRAGEVRDPAILAQFRPTVSPHPTPFRPVPVSPPLQRFHLIVMCRPVRLDPILHAT